jgi:hypothetical protein
MSCGTLTLQLRRNIHDMDVLEGSNLHIDEARVKELYETIPTCVATAAEMAENRKALQGLHQAHRWWDEQFLTPHSHSMVPGGFEVTS